jgi:uncharacterized protein YraI
MISTDKEFEKAKSRGKPVFVIASDGVHLRAAPSLNDGTPIVALMPFGSAFKLTGDSRIGFVEGQFDGKKGWTYSEFLANPGVDPGAGNVATVKAGEGLNLRSGPSLEADVVTLMPNGSKFTLTGGKRLGFLAGTLNGQAGWAFGEFLDPVHPKIADIPVLGSLLAKSMRDAGMTITQGPFDPFSHSICDCYDFGVPIGTPVNAVAGGKVIVSEATDSVYRQNMVVVRTDQLGDHLYGHLSERRVEVGAMVSTGELLGLSGTENGPHLHLQLDHGFSQLGLSLTQILARQGFDVHSFPALDGVNVPN